MSNCSELLARLDVLAVFRGLLADAVIAALRAYVCNPSAQAYGLFMSALVQATNGSVNLAAYIRDIVCDDENVFLLRAAMHQDIAPSIKKAVDQELKTLQQIADLSSRDLLEMAEQVNDGSYPIWADYAPSFVNNPLSGEPGHIDISAAYWASLANVSKRGYGMYARYRMFYLGDAGQVVPVHHPDPTRLTDLFGYERQRKAITDNTLALLDGKPAANILLSGDAGTGKSATVKAIANELSGQGLRVIEVRKDQLHDIPDLLDSLALNPLKFILFIDDLSFARDDDNYAALKAILEGSVAAKSPNVVIYATSNRRHLVKERFSDREGDDIHRNDTMQETISLSERFGLHITFDKPDKQTYLDIVHHLIKEENIHIADQQELDRLAEQFVLGRGGRSARAARQFVDSLLAGHQ